MKRIPVLLIFVLLMPLLSSCSQSGFVMIGLVTHGEHILENGETIHGMLIISGGELAMEAGSQIDGAVYMLEGNLLIDAEITGSVSFIGGSLNLGPNAIIRGDLNTGGTELTISPQATILGDVNSGSGIQMPSLPDTQGPSLGERIIRTLIEALVLGSIAYVLMRYRRVSLIRVSEAVAKHPSVSLSMGVLVAIISISLLITIAFTILLIPVSLLGLLVLGIAVIYGWIACGVAVALFVEGSWNLKIKPETSAFVCVMILVGSINLLSSLSIIGGFLLLLVSCLGLGAVFLTRFGLRSFEPATDWEDNQSATHTSA